MGLTSEAAVPLPPAMLTLSRAFITTLAALGGGGARETKLMSARMRRIGPDEAAISKIHTVHGAVTV